MTVPTSRWSEEHLRLRTLRSVTEVFTCSPSENVDRSEACRWPPDAPSQTFTFSLPTKMFREDRYHLTFTSLQIES
jgi:hypothetical protein